MPKEICPAEGLLLEMPKEICPRRWKKPSSQRRFPSKEIAFTNYFLAKGDFHNKAEYTTSNRWSLNWQFIQQDTSTLKKKIFYSQCQRRFAPSFNWNVESNPRNILKRLEQSIYDFTGQQQKQQVPPHSKWTSCMGRKFIFTYPVILAISTKKSSLYITTDKKILTNSSSA